MEEEFPILKSLRTNFEFSQMIIITTAILFNLSRMEYDDEGMSDNEDDEDDEGRDDSDDEDYIVIDEDNRDTIRA